MASLTSQDVQKKSQNYIPPSKEKVITWISLCWKLLSPEIIKKGWNIFSIPEEIKIE